MLGGPEKSSYFFKLNEYSCKLSELKELCLMSPYVKFILVFTNYYAKGKLPYVSWEGTKKFRLIYFFKVNEYPCKLSELNELCLKSPNVKFILFFTNWYANGSFLLGGPEKNLSK